MRIGRADGAEKVIHYLGEPPKFRKTTFRCFLALVAIITAVEFAVASIKGSGENNSL